MTLVEITIAMGMLIILMVALTLNLQQEATALSTIARKTYLHTQSDVIVERISEEMKYATGFAPQAWLGADLLTGDTGPAFVDTTRGFPDRGYLLLEPGSPEEERISYEGITTGPASFTNLERAFGCGNDIGHFPGILVLWGSMASAIDNQVNPPVDFYDGISQETNNQVFYRGDGTGFAFQVPVDLAGDGTYFDGNGDIQWGAEVQGVATLDGFSCFYFEPAVTITEIGRRSDMNEDGDQVDVFDLGRIRMRSWDSNNPGAAYSDVALGPAMILQEQCNWGGDLDGDGFEDPIFLWDRRGGRLRVRLFVLAEARKNIPHIRRLEATLFLRNGIDNN